MSDTRNMGRLPSRVRCTAIHPASPGRIRCERRRRHRERNHAVPIRWMEGLTMYYSRYEWPRRRKP